MGADKYNGLCVFDYDNTLTRGGNATDESCGGRLPRHMHWTLGGQRIGAGIYAKDAVKACKLNGMAIGVASAAPCPSGQAGPSFRSRIRLLEQLGFPKEVAPGGGKPGPAYVCFHGGVQDKGLEVRKLDKFYGVPPERTVMWDDDKGWLGQVKWGSMRHPEHGQPKAHTVLASSTDGCRGEACEAACGLSKAETEAGLRKVLGHSPKMPVDGKVAKRAKSHAHIGAAAAEPLNVHRHHHHHHFRPH
eukprot:TRINITY_DN44276_c0_g1_i1.p1 TRINITY_DN44276_c0_g1~~TRINITY_DN44276_c0_g1_i1.p1  ORF type:complete len:246 (+),score=76.67 TRINITY_DN44276_c0_g1_i1:61-798(+)